MIKSMNTYKPHQIFKNPTSPRSLWRKFKEEVKSRSLAASAAIKKWSATSDLTNEDWQRIESKPLRCREWPSKHDRFLGGGL